MIMQNGPATEALGEACAGVRAGGDDDAFAGVQPDWVAYPESADEASALLRVAAERGLSVFAAGEGSKLSWGGPPSDCDLLIDTSCLTLPNGTMIDHSPGDLVARVSAGMPLRTFQELLAAEGQQLALDNPVGDGTIGGILATGLAGPRRLLYGEARDLLIGMTVVLADGSITRSGGKVVKNVAGYDLGKLFTGSLGTLGLIVDATFRLHPLPPECAYVTCVFADAAAAATAAQAVLHSQLVPSAIEVDRTAPQAPVSVGVLLEGAATSERSRAARRLLGYEAQSSPEPPLWWGRLPDGNRLLELRPDLTDLADALDSCRGPVRGSLGVLYTTDDTSFERAVELRGVRPPTHPLMERIKERFDPSNRLSPGRYGI